VLTSGTNGNINSLRSNQVNPAFTEGFQDNATKVWAKHTVSFGGEFWHQTLNRQTQAGEYPVISTVYASNPASVPALAGLSSIDRANAQQFVDDLTGTVGTIT
jgi:hypothetical protein